MKLTKLEERAARATMCAVFPPTPGLTVSISDMDLEGFARYAVSGVPLKPALGFRVVIWIAMLAPIFVLGRLRTILGISDEERDQVVSALISSRIYEVRALFVFFKAFTALYLFTSDRFRAEITRVDRREGELHESGPRPIAAGSLVRAKEAVGG